MCDFLSTSSICISTRLQVSVTNRRHHLSDYYLRLLPRHNTTTTTTTTVVWCTLPFQVTMADMEVDTQQTKDVSKSKKPRFEVKKVSDYALVALMYPTHKLLDSVVECGSTLGLG